MTVTRVLVIPLVATLFMVRMGSTEAMPMSKMRLAVILRTTKVMLRLLL